MMKNQSLEEEFAAYLNETNQKIMSMMGFDLIKLNKKMKVLLKISLTK